MTTYVRVHVYILFHALGYGMHASDVFFFLKKNMCVHTAHGFFMMNLAQNMITASSQHRGMIVARKVHFCCELL